MKNKTLLLGLTAVACIGSAIGVTASIKDNFAKASFASTASIKLGGDTDNPNAWIYSKGTYTVKTSTGYDASIKILTEGEPLSVVLDTNENSVKFTNDCEEQISVSFEPSILGLVRIDWDLTVLNGTLSCGYGAYYKHDPSTFTGWLSFNPVGNNSYADYSDFNIDVLKNPWFVCRVPAGASFKLNSLEFTYNIDLCNGADLN